jgi:hypothetical protein
MLELLNDLAREERQGQSEKRFEQLQAGGGAQASAIGPHLGQQKIHLWMVPEHSRLADLV